jgi:hypothetical protein
MKRLLTIITAVLIWAQFGPAVVEACGAKFLVATGTAFLQRSQRTRHPARILVYQHSRHADTVAFVSKLRDMLKGMGHQVTIADDEAELRDAPDGAFNVVMLKLDEARRMRSGLASSLPNATILPMDALVPSPVIALAKQEFGRMLVLPATTNEVYSIVEDAHR